MILNHAGSLDRSSRSARCARLAGILALALCSGFAAAQSSNPERLFQEAVEAQERGDDVVAAQKYQALLRLRPQAVVVRVNLGAALAHLDRFSEAIDQYRIVLLSDPTNVMARMNLALAYQGNGDLVNAVAELEQLHREEPGEGQAVLMLADCYLQSARYRDAVALLAPLESAKPDDPNLQWLLGSAMIHVGRAREGVERVEKMANKAADADAYLLAGQTRLAMNQYDLARQDADGVQSLNPKLPGLQTLNGMILERTGDYDAAEAALQQAIAADANDFNAHLYLGAIFYFNRELEKARPQLTRALELQPDSAQARYEMALVARADGQLDAARKSLETVIRHSPEWLQPHVELSALYYRLHRPEDGAKEKAIVDRLMAAEQQSGSQTIP